MNQNFKIPENKSFLQRGLSEGRLDQSGRKLVESLQQQQGTFSQSLSPNGPDLSPSKLKTKKDDIKSLTVHCIKI